MASVAKNDYFEPGEPVRRMSLSAQEPSEEDMLKTEERKTEKEEKKEPKTESFDQEKFTAPPSRRSRRSREPSSTALEKELRNKIEHASDLQEELSSLKATTIHTDMARELTYKALFKGAALQRIATIVENLTANTTARRIAFRQLAMALTSLPGSAIDVRQALTNGLNRRGWETHLQMLRREQLALLAENARLFKKIEELKSHATQQLKATEGAQLPREALGVMHLERVVKTVKSRILSSAFFALLSGGRSICRRDSRMPNEKYLFPFVMDRINRTRSMYNVQAMFFHLLIFSIKGQVQKKVFAPGDYGSRKSWQPGVEGIQQSGGQPYAFALKPSYYPKFPSIKMAHSYVASRLPPLNIDHEDLGVRRSRTGCIVPSTVFFRPTLEPPMFQHLGTRQARAKTSIEHGSRKSKIDKPKIRQTQSQLHAGRRHVDNFPPENIPKQLSGHLSEAYQQLLHEMLDESPMDNAV